MSHQHRFTKASVCKYFYWQLLQQRLLQDRQHRFSIEQVPERSRLQRDRCSPRPNNRRRGYVDYAASFYVVGIAKRLIVIADNQLAAHITADADVDIALSNSRICWG